AGDFENGMGEFVMLEIPHRPMLSLPPLQQPGLVITIETRQIEISLDGNFHDYGLDIVLKLTQDFSPVAPAPLDLAVSAFDCCGNGFERHDFISGSVDPTVVPLPATLLPLLAGAVGLAGAGRRRARLRGLHLSRTHPGRAPARA
ncbi:MAG: hypothetical protein ACU85V_19405, partial [Gammaproteobacteria bacterium]